MEDLDDPMALSLVCLVIMISFNLIFNNEIISGYKTHVIRRTRASVSAIMHELGKKSKNYYRMRDQSFWKLHSALKDKIHKKDYHVSRRSRKKRKRNPNQNTNGLMCSSVRLSIALRVFAGGYPLDVHLVHVVIHCEVHLST